MTNPELSAAAELTKDFPYRDDLPPDEKCGLGWSPRRTTLDTAVVLAPEHYDALLRLRDAYLSTVAADEQKTEWAAPWESLIPPTDEGDVVPDPYEAFGAFDSWVKGRYPWMDSLDIYQVADLYGLCCELAYRSEHFRDQQPSGQEEGK